MPRSATLLVVATLLCVGLAAPGSGQGLAELRIGVWVTASDGRFALPLIVGLAMGGTWALGEHTRLDGDVRLDPALRAGGLALRWRADLGGRWHAGLAATADWHPAQGALHLVLPALVLGAHGQPFAALGWDLDLRAALFELSGADGQLRPAGLLRFLPAGELALHLGPVPGSSFQISGRVRFLDLESGPLLIRDLTAGLGTNPG